MGKHGGFFLEYEDILDLAARGPGEGFLSISLDFPPGRRHEEEAWRPLLNSGLTRLAQQYPGDRQLERTIDEAVKELLGLDREARYRSLFYFRSADGGWSWWRSIQGTVDTRFAWGRRPAVFPLITHLHREPPVGVFLVSQEEVHWFTWRQSILREGERWELDLDTEDWRRYAGAAFPQPQRAPKTVTHVDLFQRRLAQALQRKFATFAPKVEEAAATHRWQGMVVFGASDIRDMFIDALNESWQGKIIETPERRFPTVDLKQLNEAVSEAVAAWRQQRDREELSTLLGSIGAGKRGVVGGQEVLDLLANDRVYRLYICADLQGTGYRRRDGSMGVVAGLSPLRLRVTPEQAEQYVEEPNFLEEVVALAINRKVEVVPMHGACGEHLRGLGGLGAYLRY